MRLINKLIAVFLLTAMSTCQALAGAKEDVVSAYTAWDSAFNAGDAKAIAAFYPDNAIFLPATHDVMNGPAAVEKFFAGLFGMGVTGHKLQVVDVRESGNLVVAVAKWSATGKDANGADQPWGGVATHVFEKQPDGTLKLQLHTLLEGPAERASPTRSRRGAQCRILNAAFGRRFFELDKIQVAGDFDDHIYEAAVVPEIWPTVLHDMMDMTSAMGAALVVTRGSGHVIGDACQVQNG